MQSVRIKDFFIIIIITIITTYILMNASVKLYLEQQHYEEKYPLLSFFEYLNQIPDNKLFYFADQVKKVLMLQQLSKPIPTYAQKDTQPKPPSQIPEQPKQEIIQETVIAIPHIQENIQETKLQEGNIHDTNNSIKIAQEEAPKEPIKTLYTLNKGDKVVLIGDSLMQGVGMTLVSRLNKQGAQVINLSKQNTGLTYKKYFDWEQALQNTLQDNPDIKYVIALFGANDPWDMPNPHNKNRRLKFKSKEWEEVYRQRIEAILTLAKQYNAHIFWYQVPRMKDAKLDRSVAYLNSLYEEEVLKFNGIFLPSNDLLTQEGEFSTYITNEAKQKIKVRANDGIHFTGAGSRLLSSLFIKQLTINNHEQNKK